MQNVFKDISDSLFKYSQVSSRRKTKESDKDEHTRFKATNEEEYDKVNI